MKQIIRKRVANFKVKFTTPYICMRKAALIFNKLRRYHLLIGGKPDNITTCW